MSRLRRHRAAIALFGSLVAVLGVLAALTGGGRSGELDPQAYDPTGAHAVAQLLADRGVRVIRTTDLPSTQDAATADSTVFAPLPQDLSNEELTVLSSSPADVVVAGAEHRETVQLTPAVKVGGHVDSDERNPRCALPAAVNAGTARSGGPSYRLEQEAGTSCYGGTLVGLPQDRLVLVGDASFVTNGHLDQAGNAALALGLLGRHRTLVWLVPSPDRAVLGERPLTSPDDLLPGWVTSLELGLLLAVVVLALQRGRRLGRVVPEPLPVVVPAAETTEGRGRLYRAAGARGPAAEALRAGARARLAPRLGAGPRPSPETLVALVGARTGRSAAEVQALLYGPQPADDGALVRLAGDLDTLVQNALTQEATPRD